MGARTTPWFASNPPGPGWEITSRSSPFRRNFGQTAATQAGIDDASGDLIATLDGDGQNDPRDIVPLARRLVKEELDLIVGWRKSRQDGFLLRRFPSLLANRLIGRVTGVRLHDYGCSLKVYRTSVLRDRPPLRRDAPVHPGLVRGLHLTKTDRRGGCEPPSQGRRGIQIRHQPDLSCSPGPPLRPFLHAVLDPTGTFLRNHRPGLGGRGWLTLTYLAWVKFGLGEDIGTRPLLLVGIVLMIASLQFITTGVVAELLTRTYFESSRVKPYLVRITLVGVETRGQIPPRPMTNSFPELGFWPRKGPIFLVVLAIGLAFFQNLGNAPLFDRDEGAFSEATREMVESGNYVSTTLNGEPRYDKPILTYYAQAVGVALLGWTEWGLRLHSALAACLWVLVVWGFARREWDETTGWVAADSDRHVPLGDGHRTGGNRRRTPESLPDPDPHRPLPVLEGRSKSPPLPGFPMGRPGIPHQGTRSRGRSRWPQRFCWPSRGAGWVGI